MDGRTSLSVRMIGLPAIDCCGIRHILASDPSRRYVVKAGDLSCADATGNDTADCLVVGAATFISHPDIFLPRRHKVIVRINGMREESAESAMAIYDSDDEMCILETFGRIARSLDSMDTDQRGLSQRETDVVRAIAAGMTNKEIADELCISVNTVITHRKNISSKLGIRSASGISLYALMNGLI